MPDERYRYERERGGEYGGGRIGGGYDRERDFGYDRAFDAEGYGDFNRGDYVGPQQSFRGRGPKNYQRSDQRIHEDVCERLAEDERVDASDIEVNVSAGVVSLTGSVDDRYAKRRAEDIADSCSGVKDVQNQIRVNR